MHKRFHVAHLKTEIEFGRYFEQVTITFNFLNNFSISAGKSTHHRQKCFIKHGIY